ncbi:hypothetical protein [Halostagnicola sp. A56]|nr:hypothetical protein [Halostagnicola sp. A56]
MTNDEFDELEYLRREKRHLENYIEMWTYEIEGFCQNSREESA